MQGFGIPVGVDISCDLNIRVSHELLRHVYRDARRLQVGAERVPETVWCEVRGYLWIFDFVPFGFTAHLQIHGPLAGPPHGIHGAAGEPLPGRASKHRVKRLSLGLFEEREEGGVYGYISDSGVCFWAP